MKRILGLFIMLCACSHTAFAMYIQQGLSGPAGGGDKAYAAWTTGAVPTAAFATSNIQYDCENTNSTSPTELCGTPTMYGQAACTDQGWSVHDMNVSTVGAHCWCRRTHVRVNNAMVTDIGPWYLADIYNSASECSSDCAYRCLNVVTGYCPYGRGALMFLQRY